MKTILCYGDSNTWGQIPLKDFSKARYPRDVRWTGMLQELLGRNFRIIEEGNNGRTTGCEDPLRAGRNGLSYLAPCLDSHMPLDLVILMLGTNDLKLKFEPGVTAITQRMRKLVQITKFIGSEPPNLRPVDILVLAPPIIKPKFYSRGDFSYPEAESFSKNLGAAYEDMCLGEKVHFLDAGLFVETSELDGAHFDEESHLRLATAVKNRVLEIIADRG